MVNLAASPHLVNAKNVSANFSKIDSLNPIETYSTLFDVHIGSAPLFL